MTTTLRLALAGSRVDVLRIALTAIGSALTALALLAAITVASIGTGDGPYTSELLNQGGLHPGVVVALVALCVPTLVLLAQCSRIGGPARDRRLSAVRAAGATPAELVRVVAAESGLAALFGSVLGTGVFFGLRALLDSPVHGTFVGYVPASSPDHLVTRDSGHAYRLPTDVAVPWWAFVVVALAVPLVVSAATVWALRRVAFTPFGTQRQRQVRTPRVLPLIALAAGIGLFVVVAALLSTGAGLAEDSAVVFGGMVLGLVLVAAGLLCGQGALTAATGRFLVRRTSDPALLLASRRLIDDPFATTRSTAVLTVAVLIAAGAQRVRDVTLAGIDAGPDRRFFTGAYYLVDLVLVVVAVLAAAALLVAAGEGIVARRRTYAAVVAAGMPRAVVARAVLAEVLIPLVPSVVLAAASGTLAALGLFGWHDANDNTRFVDLAWGPLGVVVLATLALTAAITSLSLLFLRQATDVAELRAA